MVGSALEPILVSFAALFVIMDPFASIPVFLALTKRMNEKQRAAAAFTATVVAGAVIVGFALIGTQLLGALGIRMESFQIAGGLLLLLTAVQMTFGIDFGERGSEPNVAVVLIGVPLLAGPGAMVTSVLLAGSYGIFTVVAAALVATALCYAILLFAGGVGRVFGKRGMEISSRLMGILLAAIGVEYIRVGFGF